MAEEAQQDTEVLFSENGASWTWVLAGPVAAAAMFAIQITSGAGVQWVVPLVFLVLVSGFIAVQIKAARIHTSVELTPTSLRQGMETIRVDEIVTIYPAPTNGMRSYYDDRVLNRAAGRNKSNALANRAMKKAGLDPAEVADKPAPPKEPVSAEKWQSARALGELTGVPRGRTGIGLKLTGGRTAQAWARRHPELRAALTTLVDNREPRS